MYVFIVVLILIVCVLLAIVVLVQNSKGGGLAANFSAPNQIMGVRKTTDFVEKATWILAVVLVVLSIVATASIPNKVSDASLKTNVQVENTLPANASPVNAAAQPAQGDAQGQTQQPAQGQAQPATQQPEAK